jgi:hypothetical protein
MLNEPDNPVAYVFAYGFVDHTVEIEFKILFTVVFTRFYSILLGFDSIRQMPAPCSEKKKTHRTLFSESAVITS